MILVTTSSAGTEPPKPLVVHPTGRCFFAHFSQLPHVSTMSFIIPSRDDKRWTSPQEMDIIFQQTWICWNTCSPDVFGLAGRTGNKPDPSPKRGISIPRTGPRDTPLRCTATIARPGTPDHGEASTSQNLGDRRSKRFTTQAARRRSDSHLTRS